MQPSVSPVVTVADSCLPDTQYITTSITLHLLNDSESLTGCFLAHLCFQRRNLRPLLVEAAVCTDLRHDPGPEQAGDKSRLGGLLVL